MDKDRKILLIILSVVLLFPLIIFLSFQSSELKSNKKRLEEYKLHDSDIIEIQNMISELENYRNILKNTSNQLNVLLFSENNTSFYDYCDFIINSAENRGLKLSDYSTNDSSSPKRLSITAIGEISGILSFLEHLYTYEKSIDIPKLSISLKDSEYELIMSINYLTVEYYEETIQ